jgi:hypothetical protein
VELHYLPRSVVAGFSVSAATVVGLLGFVFWRTRRRGGAGTQLSAGPAAK